MAARSFPNGFLWGAATSAYQIEGHPLAGGAGASIWHRFSHNPGRIANGDSGDIACDHYHRWAEDVELMAQLGLQGYRFSVAWGRILPEGRGQISQAGLSFYSRLVDRLLERGIQPMLTLYHWDLPAALHDRGGWLNPDSAAWFSDYAQILFKALGDRVPYWVTINEPWVVAVLGYLDGCMAPGHSDLFEAPRVAHNLLLAHGDAVAAYRTLGSGHIGIALNLEPQHPATSNPKDTAAAARRDAFINRWFLDPLLLGSYPAALPEVFRVAWPEIQPGELERISTPSDFIGINYYSRGLVCHAPETSPLNAIRITPTDAPLTAMDWEVYPQGLTETLLWFKERYANPPIFITENGAAFEDRPPEQSWIQDPDRVSYLRSHIAAAAEALRNGVDLRGYFAWSLLDNFEWALGFDKRFGLVGVDPKTQSRTLKASADFYRSVIASNGASALDHCS